MPTIVTPYIPLYITVHLGPPDSNAENITVSFPDYIKNVASSEIYPTWDESAIYANIYAQISFALNRVYLEYYRSRGYNFNITNSTAYDQAFNPGRNIFQNVERIVDSIFNNYIRRVGFIEPLAASYCNGTTVTCSGLSQWGSQSLAEQGYNSVNILKFYYGENIELVSNAPIQPVISSYPGYNLTIGSSGNSVIQIQVALNRISQNYPAIPKVYPVDGIFGTQTQKTVLEFQRIFGLVQDGIVGKSTWYRIIYLYTGIKRLAQLDSEGQQLTGIALTYPDPIVEGDKGEDVFALQYFLSILSEFYYDIPFIDITGIFGKETKNAVMAFQRSNNLKQTGEVDDKTWNEIYRDFIGIENTVLKKESINILFAKAFSGEDLSLGAQGANVLLLQQYLDVISRLYKSVPDVNATGLFNEATEKAVMDFQDLMGLKVTGIVNKNTWNSITETYQDVLSSVTPEPTQYPGYELSIGSNDLI